MPISRNRTDRTRLITGVLCIGLLAVVACAIAIAYPVKVRDARGKDVTLKAKPARVVSLAPNITEMLFALGAGDRVAGVTKYCNYPAEAGKKPQIGDMNAKAESILARKPDLVIGHSVMNDTLITQLERLRTPVFGMNPKTIAETQKDIKALGQIVGAPAKAESIVKKMQADIASVKSARAGKKADSVLVVIQASPLWAAGPDTFVDEMLKIANAKNVAHDARSGFVTFSKELAISRSPEVIIVGSEADKKFFLSAPAWKTTRAAKTGRVYVINNDLLVRPGPRLTEGLKQLANYLNSK